jgi:hypothetical protein
MTEQANTCNFLACHISYFGETDTAHKTDAFNYECGTIFRMLKNKTRPNTQITFYKTMAILTGLYVIETSVMSPRDRSRLQAAEMLFLRSVAGLT